MKIKLFTGKAGLKKEGLNKFTTEEEYKFLIQNGKYNKRHSSNVQSKIDELKKCLDLDKSSKNNSV